jgi:hypothetical protein
MIRKISIGPDAFKQMHYILGQEVLDKSYTISTMMKRGDNLEIWIKKDGEEVLWKEFTKDFPLAIEYHIDYSREISA